MRRRPLVRYCNYSSMRYLICFFAASLAWADISNANVEPAGAHHYRLAFDMELSDTPVSIFSSHSPDQIEDDKPSIVTHTSPAHIALPRWTGRVYFHLKTVKG